MALFDVIKYNGGPDVLAWKYPTEELGTWSQLIVNQSQEVVLVKGGQVYDVFGAGRHTLSTANIPLLRHVINLPFGGRSPFTAEVWYINQAYKLDIPWGTPTPIQLQDPKYELIVPVRSNGMFGIRVNDSKKFLVKLVSTLRSFDQDTLSRYFRGLYISQIKDAISSYLTEKKISILEMNSYLNELSESLRKSIAPGMLPYGIELVSCFVNDISVPEDDEAVTHLKAALARRAEMNLLGFDYRQERSFDVLDSAAKNESSGAAPLMGAGLGLGMGIGAAGSFGAAFGDLAKNCDVTGKGMPDASAVPPAAEPPLKCPACGNAIPYPAKFCPECGHALGVRCSKCGAALVGAPKFCPECGEKL